MNYKVLITASGTGSRLKTETQELNKALVDIGGKPTVEYILEKYHVSIPIVVTIGFKADQVQSYLEKNHPERIFEFIVVDKYEGNGSSLGYSMLQAEQNLQCPFIFHACDTIITSKIPAPEQNWIIGFYQDDVEQYATLSINNNKVIGFKSKGLATSNLVHIGIVGIKSFEKFWRALKNAHKNRPNDSTLNDISGLSIMLDEGTVFNLIKTNTWLDTGNPKALKQTRIFFKQSSD